MSRPSSIDRLPKEVRELIGQLRSNGSTINEILAKLRELDVDVSHSAMGRHVKTLAQVGERLHRSKIMAEALTNRFGDDPDNQVGRMNMELAHSMIFELLTAAGAEDEDGEPMVLDPKSARFLTGALKDLASAQKVDADRVLKLREEFARETAASVDQVAKAQGWSAETAAEVRARIFGVKITKVAGQAETS